MPRSSHPLLARAIRQALTDSAVGLLAQVTSLPLLTEDAERALGAQVQTGRTAQHLAALRRLPPGLRRCLLTLAPSAHAARDTLVLANVRLALSVVQRYACDRTDPADLVQQGMVGLLEAADRYDPRVGVRFATYAIHWIRKHVGDSIQRHVAEAPPLSMALAPSAADDSRLPDVAPSSAADAVLDAVLTRAIQHDLARLMHHANLSALERRILAWRYDGDGGGVRSQEAIGRQLGLPAQRVSAIENGALQKLRHTMHTLFGRSRDYGSSAEVSGCNIQANRQQSPVRSAL